MKQITMDFELYETETRTKFKNGYHAAIEDVGREIAAALNAKAEYKPLLYMDDGRETYKFLYEYILEFKKAKEENDRRSN